MFDLKVMNSVLDQLEEERGISRHTVIETIESALATAYKKEYGKKGQVVRAEFSPDTGGVEFYQVKTVVDDSTVRDEEEEPQNEEDERPRFDPEKHLYLEDAKRMKKDVSVGDELVFPLEQKDDYGRIAAQTAKQVIIQKLREAEKSTTLEEYGSREGEIVTGTVQRIERGNVYLDLGRAVGVMPYDEQIPGERFRQGERVRAYLYKVEESPRGVFLRLSRSHPEFLKKLFELEAPELANKTIEIIRIAREPGSRSKIAVITNDEHIDPVGSLVGQRGVRVGTVISELGGEKIDIIEYSEEQQQFVAEALSPADVLSVELDEENGRARVDVAEDQQSLAIGRGGQNVRLAAKLTGWKIDIHSAAGESLAEADEHGEVEIAENADQPVSAEESETPVETAAETKESPETPDEQEDAGETGASEGAHETDENNEEQTDEESKEQNTTA